MERKFKIAVGEDYREVATFIVDLLTNFHIFTLEGNLGAGKTTLVKEVCELIGSEDVVTSPTFALINPYMTRLGEVFHMDMYRINSMQEAIEFGIEEYLWDSHYCFIEWPEIIQSLLPSNYVRIKMKLGQDQSREISIQQIVKQDK